MLREVLGVGHGVKGGVWDRSCRAHTVLDSIPSIASIIPKMQMMRGSGGDPTNHTAYGGRGVRGPGTGTYAKENLHKQVSIAKKRIVCIVRLATEGDVVEACVLRILRFVQFL